MECIFLLKISFIYFQLCWVFAAWVCSSCEQGLLFSCNAQAPLCSGSSCWGAWARGCTGFSSCCSRALEHRLNSYGAGLSCSEACGVFSNQGWNQCLLHWQADSLPLSHQESPIFLNNNEVEYHQLFSKLSMHSPALVKYLWQQVALQISNSKIIFKKEKINGDFNHL